MGKLIVLFDGFDEMADRVRWDVACSNFAQLRRAAHGKGKVVVTCRTHYFKDRKEQVRLIGERPSLSEIETDLYRELRGHSGGVVVYLQEFDQEQIKAYLAKARGLEAENDWGRIQSIYNLPELAQRPLLLDMIVRTLPTLTTKRTVNAANLYRVYTETWLEREETKRRSLNRDVKLGLTLSLASTMWSRGVSRIHQSEIRQLVFETLAADRIEANEEELREVVREIQAASFVKWDDEEGQFTFMHPSFLQYFVAVSMFRRLTSDSFEEAVHPFGTRMLDRNVILFLTQLDEQDAIGKLAQDSLLADYRPLVSENSLLFLYWSDRIRLHMEDTIGDHQELRESLAHRIPFGCKLRGAQLRGAVLDGACFRAGDLRDSDLSRASLRQAEIVGADLTSADLSGARCDGILARESVFRGCDLRDTKLTNARCVECDFTDAKYDVEDIRSAKVTRSLGLSVTMVSPECLSPTVELGKAPWIEAMTFSRNWRSLAIGRKGGTVDVYEMQFGRLVHEIEAHAQLVTSLEFTPDGSRLLSGGDDRVLRLWDVNTGGIIKEVGQFKLAPVCAVGISPDGRHLAAAHSDGSVRLFDAEAGSEVRVWSEHFGPVNSLSYCPMGTHFVSAGDDGTIRLWDADNKESLLILRGHEGWISSVRVSPNGSIIASGGFDNSVRIWGADAGQARFVLHGHTRQVTSVSFSCDGSLLASSSDDGTVRLWDVGNGSPLGVLRSSLVGGVRTVGFVRGGKVVVAGGEPGCLQFWNVEAQEVMLSRYWFGRGVWLDVGPGGRFHSSPEGLRYLSYSEKNSENRFTGEQVYDLFHESLVVQETLSTLTEEETANRESR